jgi:hypothetical protein
MRRCAEREDEGRGHERRRLWAREPVLNTPQELDILAAFSRPVAARPSRSNSATEGSVRVRECRT